MNNVYEELDEAKNEIETLKIELRGKTGSFEILKQSHDAQVNIIQEAISKVEKLEQELHQKAHEYHKSNLCPVEHWEQQRTNDRLKQFKPCTKECELEKSTLLDEISLLKSKLDSHIKISQDLQYQLQMCKELLAHEDAHVESQRKALEVEVLDLKLQLEFVNSQKDKDVEDLTNSLKYSNEKLEQENHQLRKSLRELQESQEEKASYSLSTLRSNLRGLEQTHKECVSIFQTRQVGWSFKLEQMRENIENYRYALETKATKIEKLEMELECSDSSNIEMMLLNEEMYVMLLVLKEGIYEHNELQQSVNSGRNYHKVMLEDSTKCRSKVYGGLEKPNIELDGRTCEINEMEFELQMWKSLVESLENDLKENRVTQKALEKSLLAQVDFSESLKQEKDSLDHKLEVEENKIDYLQLHVFVLEQELIARETKASEQESFRTNDFEIKNHIKGKNMTTNELMQHVTSLEKKFQTSLIPFNSQLDEKHAEIIQVREIGEKISEAEALAIIEFEEKKLTMEELEDDINDMENKLKLQEENLNQLKQLALDIEMKIDSKQLRIKELNDQMENKLIDSDVLLQKIKMEDKSLLENSAIRETLLGFVMGLGDKMSDYTAADTNLTDVWKNSVQSFEKDCVGETNFKNDDELFVKENMIVHSPTRLNKSENFSDLVIIQETQQ
ncbi:hypothetical protein TSUD_237820 [Trifolium subterraneum]|uniref:Uncharacterized protein n=1 Tax=Trifolium subterraneum TaxID=3900 RepID=A0A2Z6LYF9_TRISU|nr:hypothetical protein TSUD_237820 [Trifolium subterraneum]